MNRTCGWTACAALGMIAALGAAPHAAGYPRPGATEALTLTPDGAYSTGAFSSIDSALSRDGRFVAFDSAANDLVALDTNLSWDVFVRDRKKGKTELVSVTTRGIQAAAGGSMSPVITPDGRYVAFESTSPTLVVGDTNAATDVFVRDRKTGETTRVSVHSSGRGSRVPAHNSFDPAISDNGRFVAFASFAPDLVDNDTNDYTDIFVHDRQTGTTERVSVASDGSQATITGPGPFFNINGSSCPSISATGRYVAFSTPATNLVPNDVNGLRDVFVHDRQTDKTRLVSVASDGTQAGPPDWALIGSMTCGPGARAISANGRLVAFVSEAQTLVPTDTKGTDESIFDADVFVHDTLTGRTERVTVDAAGVEADSSTALTVSMSADGRKIAFASWGSNLFPGDTDAPTPNPFSFGAPVAKDLDVFLHDRAVGSTELISVGHDGAESGACVGTDPWRNAWLPTISPNGRSVSFSSCSPNLASGDDNDEFDLFARDRGPDQGLDAITIRTSGRAAAGWTGRTPDAVRLTDGAEDSRGLARGGELLGATIAVRPSYSDVYVRIDLDRIHTRVTGVGGVGNPAVVYGLSFRAGRRSFEVRAAETGPRGPAAAFGLFACDASGCREVLRLSGGYGTVGDTVVTAVPLSALGLADGGSITKPVAYSAHGTYPLGPVTILDRAS